MTSPRDSSSLTVHAASAPWWPDGVLLALLAIAVRLPAYFATKPLTFDDGNYAATALVLRGGAVPYRDAFSSQGPVHTPLLWLFDLAGGRTTDSPRLASVVAGVVATLALWHIARRLSSRSTAAVVGVLVATSGTMLWVAGPSTSDGLATAFAALALCAAIWWADSPGTSRAAVVGVALGAVLGTKLLALVVALPIAVLFVARRRVADAAVAVATAVGVAVASALPWGLRGVWDQSVTYHTSVPRLESVGEQVHKLLTTVPTRDLAFVAMVIAGALVTAVVARRRGAHRRDGVVTVVGAWLAVVALLLVFEKNMWTNHLALLVPPAAVLVALRPPPRRVAAAVLAVALPVQATQLGGVLWRTRASGPTADAIADLRALPHGAWVVSDEPGVPWRADRRPTPWTDDGSIVRILSRSYTTQRVADEIADPRVCAVLVWSYRFAYALPGLEGRMRALGYRPARTYGAWTRDLSYGSLGRYPLHGPRVLWRRQCSAA